MTKEWSRWVSKCFDVLFCNIAETLTISLASYRSDWEEQTQGTKLREGQSEELLLVTADLETATPVSAFSEASIASVLNSLEIVFQSIL